MSESNIIESDIMASQDVKMRDINMRESKIVYCMPRFLMLIGENRFQEVADLVDSGVWDPEERYGDGRKTPLQMLITKTRVLEDTEEDRQIVALVLKFAGILMHNECDIVSALNTAVTHRIDWAFEMLANMCPSALYGVDLNGESVLQCAVRTNFRDLAGFITKYKQDVTQKGLLVRAVESSSPATVKVLLDAKANPNDSEDRCMNIKSVDVPYTTAPNEITVCKFFDSICIAVYQPMSALSVAAEKNNVQTMQLLIHYGADPGFTYPLYHAAKAGAIDAAFYLFRSCKLDPFREHTCPLTKRVTNAIGVTENIELKKEFLNAY